MGWRLSISWACVVTRWLAGAHSGRRRRLRATGPLAGHPQANDAPRCLCLPSSQVERRGCLPRHIERIVHPAGPPANTPYGHGNLPLWPLSRGEHPGTGADPYDPSVSLATYSPSASGEHEGEVGRPEGAAQRASHLPGSGCRNVRVTSFPAHRIPLTVPRGGASVRACRQRRSGLRPNSTETGPGQ